MYCRSFDAFSLLSASLWIELLCILAILRSGESDKTGCESKSLFEVLKLKVGFGGCRRGLTRAGLKVHSFSFSRLLITYSFLSCSYFCSLLFESKYKLLNLDSVGFEPRWEPSESLRLLRFDLWDCLMFGLNVHSRSITRSCSCFCLLRHSACCWANLIAFSIKSALAIFLWIGPLLLLLPLEAYDLLLSMARLFWDFCRSGLKEFLKASTLFCWDSTMYFSFLSPIKFILFMLSCENRCWIR